MAIQSLCNFIAYQMGEFHNIFPRPERVLNHLLFTIGNGYDIDEETGSPVYDEKPIHLFPPFNKEEMTRKRMPEWKRHIEKRAECNEKSYGEMEDFYKSLGIVIGSEWDKDEFIKGELAKHVFPDITQEDLTAESLYQQIIEEENNSMRKKFNGEYEYVRHYPLAENYSMVYMLNEKTPKCVKEVALNFCTAWLNYLNKEIECARIGDGYSDLEWTTKHRNIIYQLTVQQLAH